MDKEIEIPIEQITGHLVPELPLFLNKLDEIFTSMLGQEKYHGLILGDLKNSIACDMVEDALGVQVNVIKEDWGLVLMYLTLLSEKCQQLLGEMVKEVEK